MSTCRHATSYNVRRLTMDKLDDLLEGFKQNVKKGLCSELKYDGVHVYLCCTAGRGYVGVATLGECPKTPLKSLQVHEHERLGEGRRE